MLATTTPSALSRAQTEAFWRDGYVVMENAVSAEQLEALRVDFAAWTDASRHHSEAFGTNTIDGRPRFDMAPEHSKDSPQLRRVNDPIAASDAYLDVMRTSAMVDGVADLIGPNVCFHHSKINSKLPGSTTEVRWHQDFAFTPHTNDDVITALLMIDDVTAENGPLEVLPGSHRGPIHSIWQDGVFTGAVEHDVESAAREGAVQAIGAAGSACFMHTRLLHGSAANLADQPRTLFIAVYSAADAIPITPSPMPTQFAGEVVRGEATNMIRVIDYELERPELPKTTSFFDQQARLAEPALDPVGSEGSSP